MTRRAWAPTRSPKIDSHSVAPAANPDTLLVCLDNLIDRYGMEPFPRIYDDLISHRDWLVERHGKDQ